VNVCARDTRDAMVVDRSRRHREITLLVNEVELRTRREAVCGSEDDATAGCGVAGTGSTLERLAHALIRSNEMDGTGEC